MQIQKCKITERKERSTKYTELHVTTGYRTDQHGLHSARDRTPDICFNSSYQDHLTPPFYKYRLTAWTKKEKVQRATPV